MSEESARAFRHRTEVLSTLVNHEGFRLLEEELRKRERRMSEAFWAILMADTTPPDMVEQMAYVKGYIRGMRYATAVPRGAERKRNGEVEDENEEVEDRWSAWVAK